MCLASWSGLANAFEHPSSVQAYGRAPVCVRSFQPSQWDEYLGMYVDSHAWTDLKTLKRLWKRVALSGRKPRSNVVEMLTCRKIYT